jgi:uncharacterized protein
MTGYPGLKTDDPGVRARRSSIPVEKGRPMTDYTALDRSPLLRYVFYPRLDFTPCPEGAEDLSVPVDGETSVSCRLYEGHRSWPWILLVHGNGEVVSDYDGIAPFYRQRRLNLAVAGYRGYGMSGGKPTLTGLVRDARVILQAVREALSQQGWKGTLFVMGRSLGSISALELGATSSKGLRGLIIESGFPSVARLAWDLGLPGDGLPLDEIDRACLESLRTITLPTLIIHGERDSLVPLREAETLFKEIGSSEKALLLIPGGDHNDLLTVGFREYFDALEQFVHGGKANG